MISYVDSTYETKEMHKRNGNKLIVIENRLVTIRGKGFLRVKWVKGVNYVVMDGT